MYRVRFDSSVDLERKYRLSSISEVNVAKYSTWDLELLQISRMQKKFVLWNPKCGEALKNTEVMC